MTGPFALPWLLPAPADFRSRAKGVVAGETFDEAEVRRLAAFALDLNGLALMGKVVTKHRTGLIAAGFAAVKLGIVSSHTMEYFAGALPGSGLRHGVVAEVVLAAYGQAAQEVLDPGSEFAGAGLDAVFLALDYRALGLGELQLRADEADAVVDAALQHVSMLADGVRDVVKATCIVQTIVAPSEPFFGSMDGRMKGSPRAMIERFNARLVHEVLRENDLLLDTAFLAGQVGLNQWHEARGWHKAKVPCALEATPLYADLLGRLLGAMRGRVRKCLVLDLDNTLWGGVIGDDGIDGILLGQNSAVGEAHVALQRHVLELRRRGVILAVCSKNDEAVARGPFQQHAEMVLREEHVAVFVANWSDKANNLREIAATLHIGTDALVFVDDNPAERAQVRLVLPEVAVPEIGSDPSDYVALLSRAGYFEAVSLSEEDLSRADFYQSNATRASLQKVGNLGEYLESLEMVATVAPFDAAGRLRITQLINKSNQFNLTTRRYSEAEVAAIEGDGSRLALQVRLADRFGDNGMISVVIFEKGDEAWTCDTWLMSCRVLGRRVEEMVLAVVADEARRAGAKSLLGRYVPTKKNGLVAQHFAKLGFAMISELADGETTWRLDLAGYAAPRLPIKVLLSSQETVMAGES